jgi:hypothetical protein
MINSGKLKKILLKKLIAYILFFILGMSVTAKYYVGFTYLMEIQAEDKKVMASIHLKDFDRFV